MYLRSVKRAVSAPRFDRRCIRSATVHSPAADAGETFAAITVAMATRIASRVIPSAMSRPIPEVEEVEPVVRCAPAMLFEQLRVAPHSGLDGRGTLGARRCREVRDLLEVHGIAIAA